MIHIYMIMRIRIITRLSRFGGSTMSRNQTVSQLRQMARDRKGEVIQLPIEFVNIINGTTTEQNFSFVGADKALSYLSDMLEE